MTVISSTDGETTATGYKEKTLWTSDNGLWQVRASYYPERPTWFEIVNAKDATAERVSLKYVSNGPVQLSGGTFPNYVLEATEQAISSELACEELRRLYQPGDTMTTLLRHVSRNGMSRSISVVKDDNDITWLVARALNEHLDDRGGITVGGAGMDMGFHLVYGLSRKLFTPFYCTGIDNPSGDFHARRCPSNDHVNPGPNKDNYSPGHVHSDGGYAIGQRWL